MEAESKYGGFAKRNIVGSLQLITEPARTEDVPTALEEKRLRDSVQNINERQKSAYLMVGALFL